MAARWITIAKAHELIGEDCSRRTVLRRLQELDARSGGRLLRRRGARKYLVSTSVLRQLLQPDPEEPDGEVLAELRDLSAKLDALRNAFRALRRRVERLERVSG